MHVNMRENRGTLQKSAQAIDRRVCVAPMMDWTDRHCRFLHRLFAPHALLYTEMLVSAALVRGAGAARLLQHDPQEHPVALQLGGCDPKELAAAARIGAAAGFAEINLNVGCPSDRVKSGAFGACLMLRPCAGRRVRAAHARCDAAAGHRQVPHRHRRSATTTNFSAASSMRCRAPACDALIVHARAAMLGGLTPKENREIPPLKYDFVHRLKRERPALPVVLNGGIADLGADCRPPGRGARRRDAGPRGLSPAGPARGARAGGGGSGLARATAVADHRTHGALCASAGAAGRSTALDHAPHARPDGRTRGRPRLAPVSVGRRDAARMRRRKRCFQRLRC